MNKLEKRNIDIIYKALLLQGRIPKIAKEYGLSHQRIHQIFKKMGISYKKLKNALCSYIKCLYCGNPLKINNGTYANLNRFCSQNCKRNSSNYINKPVKCQNCHKLFLPYTRAPFYLNTQKKYCSKKCFKLFYEKIDKNQ